MSAEHEPAAPRRARLVVAYDGGAFRGFAENRDVETVAGTLRRAIERLTGGPAELSGAGRTDAGVHAWTQVVSVDLPGDTDLEHMLNRLNRLCRPSIAVRAIDWAADDFHARFSTRWRHYRYTVWNHPAPNPLLAGQAWHLSAPLDLPAMRLGADPLVGEHDFSSFCRRPQRPPGAPEPSMHRRVLLASWAHVDNDWEAGCAPWQGLLRFEIRANAFCHQMVRSIVGLLVDVGLGRRSAGEVRSVLLARDRAEAGQIAPAHGLCLWETGER